ncbi:MAG: hypothetical protein Q4E82_01955 [Peptococcaceae bacterium]|nr:hypothetical protein [Peptococcaceae bacterium]
MTNVSDRELSRALDVLGQVSDDLRFEKICEMSAEQKTQYKQLLLHFKKVNSVNKKEVSDQQKGEALEELVSYLLKVSGNIFHVDRNLRTTTNEIDHLVSLEQMGKILLGHNLIDKKLGRFLCECKNYSKTVSVTYVGKFCSLMLTNNVRLGLLFSYHGVSGKGWNAGSGLIKKFYLHKEKIDDRYCIIDFSISDFEAVLEGQNLLQIIKEKITSLQFDTDYSKYISKHPAEE